MAIITTDDGIIITTDAGVPIATDDVFPPSGQIQLFDFSVNLFAALLWQYTNAVNLQGIIQKKQDWYSTNNQAFWQDWYRDVFDLSTANEFGLAVWSIILGLPLFINTPADTGFPTFGFGGSNGTVNFDNGILADDNGTIYNLPLETKRIALQLRYFQLVSSGTVPETNRMLNYVFGDMGSSYLLDYGTMNQAYIFLFPVSWDLAYIFNNLDILPRPAGVGSTWIDATLHYFGFGGSNGALNFDNGILGG